MAFVPVPRSSVSDHVFAQLRDAIVSGRHRPDDPLPGERELAAAFAVNRHAVREALRRLQQLGLLRVSQGGATRVLDWRVHAGPRPGLSCPVRRRAAGRAPGPGHAGDAGLRRGRRGPALRLRGPARPHGRVVVDAVERVRRAAPRPGPPWPRPTSRCGGRIVTGSGNTAYLLAFNSLVAGALAVGEVPAAARAAELLDVAGHRRLAARSPTAGRRRRPAGPALLTAPLTATPATTPGRQRPRMIPAVLYAVPAFLLLIVIEALSYRFLPDDDERGYELRDTTTSLSWGRAARWSASRGSCSPSVVYAGAVERRAGAALPAPASWTWVLLFFADDLAYYWFHRLHHEVRVFWASHVVHHSSSTTTSPPRCGRAGRR